MPQKNKKAKTTGYKLICLCIGGLILGCVIPLYASLSHNGTALVYLAVMEAIGAAALIYVFGLYVLSK